MSTMLYRPTGDMLMKSALDISEVPEAEVQIRTDGQVLWVNISGVCVLRVCRTKIVVKDDRPENMRAADELVLEDYRGAAR